MNLLMFADSSKDTKKVTYHQRQPPQTLPLLIPALRKAGWFAKTEPDKKKHTLQAIKKVFQLCNVSNMLFDQKPPALSILGSDGGEKLKK